MITRHPGLRPRNVTMTQREIDTILTAAPPDIQLWLLLCSDLAMRSGTAARISPANYDPRRRELRFVTKCDEALTLPVTAEIAAILETCDHNSPHPYVQQLSFRQQQAVGGQFKTNPTRYTINCRFRRLLNSLEIRQNLRPHDLRRTAAVRMYEFTNDARDVQALLGHRNLASTIWYLDHDLRPVSRDTLERIKRPHLVNPQESTA
jgi:integrase